MSYFEKLPEFLIILKPLVKNVTGDRPDFETIWANVTTDFTKWMQSPNRSVSLLVANIVLLGKLVDAFNNDSIRTNKAIIDMVLAGTQVGGNDFKWTNSSGVLVISPIIDRYITERYGIMLSLIDEKGKSFKWEYFD